MTDTPKPTEEQVTALGRFFAKAMDKRDGLATQEEVTAEVLNVLNAFGSATEVRDD